MSIQQRTLVPDKTPLHVRHSRLPGIGQDGWPPCVRRKSCRLIDPRKSLVNALAGTWRACQTCEPAQECRQDRALRNALLLDVEPLADLRNSGSGPAAGRA